MRALHCQSTRMNAHIQRSFYRFVYRRRRKRIRSVVAELKMKTSKYLCLQILIGIFTVSDCAFKIQLWPCCLPHCTLHTPTALTTMDFSSSSAERRWKWWNSNAIKMYVIFACPPFWTSCRRQFMWLFGLVT